MSFIHTERKPNENTIKSSSSLVLWLGVGQGTIVFFLATPHSLQDLSSQTKDWTQAHGSEDAKS